MNQSEKIAYGYLKKIHKKRDIKFFIRDTPDFKVGNKDYEVKKIYGKNTLIFSTAQIEKMDEETEIITVSHKGIKEIFKWKNREKVDFRVHVHKYSHKNIRIDEKVKKELDQFRNKFIQELKPKHYGVSPKSSYSDIIGYLLIEQEQKKKDKEDTKNDLERN